MNDKQRPAPAELPYDELHSALAEDPTGQKTLDELRVALQDERPQAGTVNAYVDRLRAIPALEARIANWFDSPTTQNWLMMLNDAGL